jgi:hypothetical protein
MTPEEILEKKIEESKKDMFMLGVEFGYLQCEKNNNIEQARLNAKKIWERTSTLTDKDIEEGSILINPNAGTK